MASCLYVVLREIGGITAPVSRFGSEPTWMTRVPKPSTLFLREWTSLTRLPLIPESRKSIEGDIIEWDPVAQRTKLDVSEDHCDLVNELYNNAPPSIANDGEISNLLTKLLTCGSSRLTSCNPGPGDLWRRQSFLEGTGTNPKALHSNVLPSLKTWILNINCKRAKCVDEVLGLISQQLSNHMLMHRRATLSKFTNCGLTRWSRHDISIYIHSVQWKEPSM